MHAKWTELKEFVKTLPAVESAKALDPALPFAEMEIDSLDLAGMFLAIEDKFQVKLIDDPARRPKSFADILEIIDKKDA